MKNVLSLCITIVLAIWAVLAAVVAIVSWHGGGLSGAGASTDLCAALLIVAGLIAIAVFLGTRSNLPRIARILGALVVLYIAVPVIAAIVRGGGLSAALANPMMPFYMRGAYICVEVVFPLAALVALGMAVITLMHRNRTAAGRSLAAFLAFALVAQTGAFEAGTQALPTIAAFEHPAVVDATAAGGAAAATGGAGSAVANDAGPSGPQTAPCFSADQGAGKTAAGSFGSVAGAFGSSSTPTPAPISAACLGVRNYMTVAQAVRNALPQRDIDMIPLAQSVPTDGPGIDTFVRDAIRLDIYSGVMRGPLGTWLGRAGNPTDKLTLLAALLKVHGISYTFVRGTLSDADTAKIISSATAVPTPDPSSTMDPAQLTAIGITQSQADSYTAQRVTQAQAYADKNVSFANGQADGLIDQLKASNVAVTSSDPSTTWSQTLRTHYWLRLANGMDLDPTTADLAPGSHLGTTSNETTNSPPTDGETAQIIVRVIETLNRNGALSDTTVLQVKHPSYDFADQSATVALAPPGDVKSADEVSTVTSVTPSFTMGTQSVNGTPIAVAPSGATLTGVRIEIERDLPGGKPEIFRRTIVGGEADAATIAAHLVRAYHLVVQTQPVNQTFATQKFLDFALSMRDYLAWAQDPASNNRGTVYNPPGLGDFPADALNYIERSEALNGAIGVADNVSFVYDRPQIVMVVDSFDRRDQKTVQQVRFDIVDNGMEVIGSDRSAAFRANVARGIADTFVEDQVIPAKDSANAPTLLHAASEQNVGMVVLDGVQKRRPTATLPDAIAANLDQTFAHGQVAVAPQQLVALPVFGQQYGWWAIDGSGNTVGRMGSGAGQELAELTTIISNILNVVNAAWAVLSCKFGTKADCLGATCSFFEGAALGFLAGEYLAGKVAAKAITAGEAGSIGIVAGGLPGPGWSPGGQLCDLATGGS